jgi:hypothetical protein
MKIVFEIPTDIAEVLHSSGADPGRTAKESLLVELYRQRNITHYQLGEALGLNLYEVDGVLKRYNVVLDLGLEEFNAEAASLCDVGRK